MDFYQYFGEFSFIIAYNIFILDLTLFFFYRYVLSLYKIYMINKN